MCKGGIDKGLGRGARDHGMEEILRSAIETTECSKTTEYGIAVTCNTNKNHTIDGGG
jgi:hypothetical protein